MSDIMLLFVISYTSSCVIHLDRNTIKKQSENMINLGFLFSKYCKWLLMLLLSFVQQVKVI